MFFHDISPILFELGPLSLRWYGLFFALGLVIAYFFVRHLIKRKGHNPEIVDSVVFYLIIGVIIGARLGHVFFYHPLDYLSNPISILYVWNGGLSSHGATLGILISYLIWLKVHKTKFAEHLTELVLGIPIVATMVRIGNFFNSEIIGIPTNNEWGVIFHRLGEDFPRHPAQLYEAALNLALFAILYLLYRARAPHLPKSFFLFLYLLLYFGGRFFIEFYKERFTIPAEIPLSMGQFLSLVPILIAIFYFLFLAFRLKKR
ncbi:prolipoprotein diacylglyceryl transferase [Candidatus Peregrinibacteria bacterium]|jgi:phosphatidylglycerol---prolipoprotein diacylglyceryl transferase|nr:prolipoprotein diacylglyceryl transferase [Candidatus Peregrinibacteria bacterium]MBT7484344.1 prolipoprotein diacylglyceryl transferase [Candidatus Peregrinibacteria bacterium]